MSGLNIQRLRDVIDTVFDAGNGVLKTGVAGSSSMVRSQAEFSATLTEPSTTTSWSFAGYSLGVIQYDITNINTSVTLRVEGSNNGTTWFNLSTSGTNTVVTTNSTDAFRFETPVKFVRVNFVSELGGTSAVVALAARFSA